MYTPTNLKINIINFTIVTIQRYTENNKYENFPKIPKYYPC